MSDRLCRAQRTDAVGIDAELGQQGIGVLAERWYRIHPGAFVPGAWRQHRRQRTRRRADLAPALPRLELGMLPEVVHRVDARVRDLRGLESLDDLRRGQWPERLDDQLAQRDAFCDALRIAGEARILRERRLQQHLLAEVDPLALVLQA